MDKQAKIIIGIIVIATIAAVGYAFYKNQNKPISNEPIKIGAILPLTGSYAIIGEELKKGIDLAADEARKDNIKFDLIYEDTQTSFGATLVSAARKLLNVDKINVGITFSVEEAKSIAPLFAEKKVPLVVGWDSNGFISSAGDYIFSNGFSTEKAGEDMADFAFKKLNLRRVALVGHIDAWAEIISASFEKRFLELGGQITFNEKLALDTNDYRSIITKLKEINFDGVYFPMVPPSNARFIIQSRQFGISAPMMTGDPLIQDVIDEAGQAAEGIYFTSAFTMKDDPVYEIYSQKFGVPPTGMALASRGYDSFRKIIEASRKSTDIQKGLLETIGSDRVINQEEKLYQVKNGVPVEIR